MMDRRSFLRSGYSLAASTILAPTLMAESPGRDSNERPNILFIMTDQQFADAMSCRMGAEYINTPAMDSLAENGMFFSRAYSPNPLCMPARSSIFTGRYPHETKVTKNAHVDIDPKDFVCMGTYFRQAGYETMYAGKWHLCYKAGAPETHGFEIPKESKKIKGRDARAADAAVRFLSQKHDKPFLAVVSFLGPHDICQFSRDQKLPCGSIGRTPEPEQCPPAPANLAPPANETDSMTILRKGYHANRMFPVGGFTEDKWRQYRWGYYRIIEEVDARIGEVLGALGKAGLERNTLIVLTSDHGECAGAHRFNQKTVFYEESARVPLIVSFKGRTGKGVCDKLVNIGVDIMPTLLDYAGISVPKKLTGRSLRPIVAGQRVSDWRDHVVIENHLSQTVPVGDIHPTAQGRMVRTERYKYCVYSRGRRRESLVDMEKDPLETKNLAMDPAYRQVLLQHRQLLRRFAEEHHDELVGELLADNAAARPFTAEDARRPQRDEKRGI